MNDEIRHAAENAMLLLLARVAQVVLVPLMSAMLIWGGHTIYQLQIEIVKVQAGVALAVSTSEANNRLLAQIVGDLDKRISRIEDRKP